MTLWAATASKAKGLDDSLEQRAKDFEVHSWLRAYIEAIQRTQPHVIEFAYSMVRTNIASSKIQCKGTTKFTGTVVIFTLCHLWVTGVAFGDIQFQNDVVESTIQHMIKGDHFWVEPPQKSRGHRAGLISLKKALSCMLKAIEKNVAEVGSLKAGGKDFADTVLRRYLEQEPAHLQTTATGQTTKDADVDDSEIVLSYGKEQESETLATLKSKFPGLKLK